jgi:hypothetical protein
MALSCLRNQQTFFHPLYVLGASQVRGPFGAVCNVYKIAYNQGRLYIGLDTLAIIIAASLPCGVTLDGSSPNPAVSFFSSFFLPARTVDDIALLLLYLQAIDHGSLLA